MGAYENRRTKPLQRDGAKTRTYRGSPLSDKLVALLFEHHRNLVPRELEMRLLPMCIPQPNDKVKIIRNVWRSKPVASVIYLPDQSGQAFSPPVPDDQRAGAIIQEVCMSRGLTVAQFFSSAKVALFAAARQEVCYRLAVETDLSLPAIGRLIQKDHSTVMHAINRYCEINNVTHPRRKHETSNCGESFCRKLHPEMA